MASNKKIGAHIALDGETKFKSAVTSCNKSLSTLRSEMSLVKAQTAGSANSLDTLKKKHEVLSKTLDEHVKKEEAVQKGLDHAREDYDRVGKELGEYKKQLEEAQSSLEKMKASGESAGKEFKEQSKTVESLNNIVESGEKTYEKAGNRVKDWEKQLNNAKSQTIKTSDAIEQNSKYMEEAENSTDKCATSIDNLGRILNSTAQQTKNLNDNMTSFDKLEVYSQYADKFSESFKQVASNAYNAALELDEGYDTIITKTGATGDALDDLTNTADNIFGSMPVNMADVGVAIGEVNTRFGQTGEILEKTSEEFLQFAEINGVDLNESIDATDRILTQFNVDISESGNFLGLLTKRGQETGKSISALMSELDSNAATFKEMNLDVVESTNLLALFETNGVESSVAIRGLKTAVNEYAKEGMSARDGLEATIQSIKNAETSTEALGIAQEVFGTRGAQVMADGIRDGRISLDGLSESMSTYGSTVADTFNATLDPWDQAAIAANNLKIAGSELTGEFLSAVTPAIETVSGAVQTVTKWFRNLPGPAKTVVSVVGAVGVGAGVAAPKIFKLVETVKTLKVASEASKAFKAMNDAQKAATTIAGVATAAEELNAAAKVKGTAAAGAQTVATAAQTTATGAQTVATGAATVAQEGLNAAMSANPVGLVIAGVTALIGVVAAFTAASSEAKSETDLMMESASAASEKLAQSQEELRSAIDTTRTTVESASGSAVIMSEAVAELEQLASKTSLTSDEQARMSALVTELNTVYPELGLQIDSVTGKLNMGIDEIQSYVDNMGKMAEMEAYQQGIQESMDQATQAYKDRIDAENELAPLAERHEELSDKIAEIEDTLARRGENLSKSYEELKKELDNGTISQKEYYDALDGVIDHTIEYEGVTRNAEDVLAELNSEYNETDELVNELNGRIDSQNDIIEEAQTAAEGYAEGLNNVKDSANGAAEGTDNFSSSQEGTAGAAAAATEPLYAEAEAFNSLSSVIQEKAVYVAESMVGMQEAVTGAVQSQMDIFAEFQAAEEVQTQTILDNMQSQVDGFNQWGENLAALANSTKETAGGLAVTIDEGLLQHLAEMGPEGAGYVAAFNQMTAEELMQANQMWTESVSIGNMTTQWGTDLLNGTATIAADGTAGLQRLGEQLGIAAGDAGVFTGQGLIEGLTKIQGQVNTAGEELGNDLIKNLDLGAGVNSPSWKSKQTGMYVDQGLAAGMRGSKVSVQSAAKEVATTATSTISSSVNLSAVRSTGYNISSGLAAGITQGRSLVIEAATRVASDAITAAKQTLDVHSPSRVFEEIGAYTIAGFVQGVEENQKAASTSVINALDFKLGKASSISGGASQGLTYDMLVMAFSKALQKTNLVMKMNGREYGRVMADMGVQFSGGR